MVARKNLKNPAARRARAPRSIAASLVAVALGVGALSFATSADAIDAPHADVAPLAGASATQAHTPTEPNEPPPPRKAAVGPSLRPGDSVFDFGVVPVDGELHRTFVLHNDGDLPLEIKNAKASCGCAAIDYDRVIPAGGQGLFEVKISGKSVRPGRIQQHIEVETNQPSFWLISMKATVDPDMRRDEQPVKLDDMGLLGR